MFQKFVYGLGLLSCVFLAVGCDTGSSAAKKVGPAVSKATDAAKEAGAKAGEVAKDAAQQASEKIKETASKATEAVKDTAAKASEAAKDAAAKAEKTADKAVDAAKENVVKPIMDAMPKIEDKIKTMSGEAATKAKAKYEAFKKQLEEFKNAPNDKMKELGEKLSTTFAELKKEVGL